MKRFRALRSYLGPVLKGNPHIAFAVDCDEIHKADPEHRVELGNHAVQSLQLFRKSSIVACRVALSLMAAVTSSRRPLLSGSVQSGRRSASGIRSGRGNTSIFVDALLHHFGNDHHFLFQSRLLGVEVTGVENCRLNGIEGFDDPAFLR